MTKRLIALRFRALISAVAMGKRKGQGAAYSKGRLVGYLLAYTYIAIVFGGLAAAMAFTLGRLFLPLGFDGLYFGMFMTAAVSIVFVLSVFETKSELFECKDNELLLSMPIKPRDIVLSRISTVLIYNYLETLLIMGPAIVVYAILGGSPVGIFGASAVTLILPLIATSLSSGAGYLVALLTKRIKNKTFFTTALYLIFFALYFVGYNSLLDGMDSLAEISPEVAAALAEGLGFIGVVGSAALLSPLPFVILLVAAALLSLTAYTLISKNYISIVTGSTTASHIAYRARRLENRGCFYALAVKEIRGFIGSPMYMLNSGVGIIFIVAIGIMALVNKNELMAVLPALASVFGEGTDPYALISAMIPMSISLIASTVFISAPALSLEGKRLWIVKSMPISARVLLLSKLVPHIAFTAPAVLLASVLIKAALMPSVEFIPFIILTPIAGVFFTALLGGVIGATLCRFDYRNDVQVVKQSAAVGVSMFSAFVLSFGISALNIWLSIVLSPIIAAALVLCVILALSAALAWLLFTVLAKKYDNIEV
jgi:ABC-2 type transport system permease protein